MFTEFQLEHAQKSIGIVAVLGQDTHTQTHIVPWQLSTFPDLQPLEEDGVRAHHLAGQVASNRSTHFLTTRPVNGGRFMPTVLDTVRQSKTSKTN